MILGIAHPPHYIYKSAQVYENARQRHLASCLPFLPSPANLFLAHLRPSPQSLRLLTMRKDHMFCS